VRIENSGLDAVRIYSSSVSSAPDQSLNNTFSNMIVKNTNSGYSDIYIRNVTKSAIETTFENTSFVKYNLSIMNGSLISEFLW
jgi:hypothetical protein